MGFFRLSGDHGVYYKWDGANRVWLALYVDDIFLISLNLANILESKKTLGADMKVKDLGVAQYLLGIELRRMKEGMKDVVLHSIVPCSHVQLRIITSFVVICVHTCEFHVNPLSWM